MLATKKLIKFKQGQIYFFKLNPAKGNEPKKTRPCLIISNNRFNKHFNTIWVLPISSSKKYNCNLKYKISPMFVPITTKKVVGNVLVQHIRDIDSNQRVIMPCQGHISDSKLSAIRKMIGFSV